MLHNTNGQKWGQGQLTPHSQSKYLSSCLRDKEENSEKVLRKHSKTGGKEHHQKEQKHTSENDLEKDPEENFRQQFGILDIYKEMASMK